MKRGWRKEKTKSEKPKHELFYKCINKTRRMKTEDKSTSFFHFSFSLFFSILIFFFIFRFCYWACYSFQKWIKIKQAEGNWNKKKIYFDLRVSKYKSSSFVNIIQKWNKMNEKKHKDKCATITFGVNSFICIPLIIVWKKERKKDKIIIIKRTIFWCCGKWKYMLRSKAQQELKC